MNMEMEDKLRTEHHMMVEDSFASGFEIDHKRARFPCCIVWTPLPVISWLIPFVGHIGICREDGVILDFAGPNFVCVDHFAFGAATRYVQIDKDKECFVSSQTLATNNRNDYEHDVHERVTLMAWDDALNKGIQDFQHRAYNMLTCNCHSFVANNLNRLGFRSGGWNVVNLAALIFRKGRWVNRASMIKSLLPFIVVFGMGVIFGGSAFLTYWALFTFVFVGWFLVGTYCFKNLISL